jgi:hypothetical protein
MCDIEVGEVGEVVDNVSRYCSEISGYLTGGGLLYSAS